MAFEGRPCGESIGERISHKLRKIYHADIGAESLSNHMPVFGKSEYNLIQELRNPFFFHPRFESSLVKPGSPITLSLLRDYSYVFGIEINHFLRHFRRVPQDVK